MPLATGTKLGPYEIVSPLGAGGMGEVYRARDSRLNRDVAIKVSAAQFSERFEREAQAIAALNHPNICTLHDIGPNYLVMEFIEGTPLKCPLPVDQALRYAIQICDALEAAHQKNIIHRDLKPANILVTASGVKLLDFGLAKIETPQISDGATQTFALTEVGVVMGTAAYMSPEQAKGEVSDARSDIFSFGVVLYEMLNGHSPFVRNSPMETMSAILRDEPAATNTPSNISNIIARCLRKSTAERFQTIAEVRAAIEQAMSHPSEKSSSIAVLPFANMSADKDNEYFSDGLAEEILNLLAKIPGLKVIARTSSFAFRGKEQDITAIAQALRVQNILEGSVRRSGNRVRVTAQLINAADGSHRWSERYDRDMTDIFALQDEIGQAISEALKLHLAPRAHPVNLEAYQLHLKGQYHRFRFTPESIAKAKEYFEQALAVDPSYAPAYSGLAGYYLVMATSGMKYMVEMCPLITSCAEKALSLDPDNSEALSLLAHTAAICEYDWKKSERLHLKAMSVEPVPSTMRFRYAAFYLVLMGQHAKALEQCRLALETDPLSAAIYMGLTYAYLGSGQYDESIQSARKGLEINENFHPLVFVMALTQLRAGLTADAITTLQQLLRIAPWFSAASWCLAAAYRQINDLAQSLELVRTLADSHGHTIGSAFYYAAAGEADAMFAALDGAYQKRDFLLLSIQFLPFFEPYRNDPRFKSLLKRMNLA
jgi:serine/threonine protein kinase/Tfp pilus assembly protein PilF